MRAEPGALVAQSAWTLANAGSAARFRRALGRCEETQEAWLLRRLAESADTEFGREHGFAALRSGRDFAARVPLRSWEEFEPWVARVRVGTPGVLGAGRVTHLAPTSGSSGARKLIPFTAGLQAGFSAAVGAWLWDLAWRRPGLLLGPSYWSVSPLAAEDEAGPVPVGFADDATYLGGIHAWLVRRALAVPASVRLERDVERFWRTTLQFLLARRELRLLSVWHPSFLSLLTEAAARHWADLCAGCSDSGRRRELREAGPERWERWWPRLAVVSCWGEQAAEPGFRLLQRRLPGVHVQAKGLLATEAAVTIPWGGAYPLAVTSHYFEFIDEGGEVRPAACLERGRAYEVVVTNGGGLWRYRLGDCVECTGHLGTTPTLRFLGRAGGVSDLRGEKLSERFVAEALRGLWAVEDPPAWIVLRAWEGECAAGYHLEVPGAHARRPGLAERAEAALSENPHYALARRLGQLSAVEVREVSSDPSLEAPPGRRLGDRKPAVLIPFR